MSANSSGSVAINAPWTSANRNGNMSLSANNANFSGGEVWQTKSNSISINVAHTHFIYLGSDDTETRPSNYTYKVWVRVS
jgi:hypothetical protein